MSVPVHRQRALGCKQMSFSFTLVIYTVKASNLLTKRGKQLLMLAVFMLETLKLSQDDFNV